MVVATRDTIVHSMTSGDVIEFSILFPGENVAITARGPVDPIPGQRLTIEVFTAPQAVYYDRHVAAMQQVMQEHWGAFPTLKALSKLIPVMLPS